MLELTYDWLRPLERTSVFIPLGIQFWDPVRDVPISDGLAVTARPEESPQPVVSAFCTASGVYAFHRLPGLKADEPPPEAPEGETDQKLFIIKVTDRQLRFLPIAFRVALPLPYRGIYRPAADSPPRFHLLSAPTRPVSPGVAVVRAQLAAYDPENPPDHVDELPPAAHALLEIEISGDKYYGIANDQGVVAVLFPYPTFNAELGASPSGTPPTEQEWELTARVRYSSALEPAPNVKLPDLGSIWNQPPGSIWPTTEAEPPAAEWTWQLGFSQELVLQIGDHSTLLISSGASPP